MMMTLPSKLDVQKMALRLTKRCRSCSLGYVKLRNLDLQYADLRQADLHGAVLTNVDLSYADLRGANLRNVTLINVVLTDADLCGAVLPNSATAMLVSEQASKRSTKRSKCDKSWR